MEEILNTKSYSQTKPESNNPQSQVDWHNWLQRWDAQQTGYLPHREARFQAMLDVLEVLIPAEFVARGWAAGRRFL